MQGTLNFSAIFLCFLFCVTICVDIECGNEPSGSVKCQLSGGFDVSFHNAHTNGNVFRMGEERGVYRVLVGKPEGKRPLGRPRRRWVDNIRMDLQEVGCGHVDWTGLAQDRDRWRTLVSAVMNLRVP